jgi:hypothetical protein
MGWLRDPIQKMGYGAGLRIRATSIKKFRAMDMVESVN